MYNNIELSDIHNGSISFISTDDNLEDENMDFQSSGYNCIKLIKEQDLIGAVNAYTGKSILPCLYEQIKIGRVNIWAKLNSKYYLFDSIGNLIIDCIYDDVNFFFIDSPCVVKNKNKYGLFDDLRAKELIRPIYDSLYFPRNEEFIISILDNKYGLIDRNGIEILPPVYEKIYFNKKTNKITAKINGRSKIIYWNSTDINAIFYHPEKEANISINRKACSLQYATDFFDTYQLNNTCSSENNIPVVDNGSYYLLDENNDYILNYGFDAIESLSICEHIISNNWHRYRVTARNSNFNGMYVISINGYIGVINQSGKIIIPPIYDEIFPCSSDHSDILNRALIVELDNKYGIITIDGKEILPPIYDNIQDLENGNSLLVQSDNQWNLFEIHKKQSHRLKTSSLRTGFTGIDNCILNKIKNNSVILLSARPAMGKTTFALQIAIGLIFQSNKKVAVFSFDNNIFDLLDKLNKVLPETDIAPQNIRGNMNTKLKEQLKIYYDFEGTLGTIHDKIIAEEDFDFIIIDCLQDFNPYHREKDAETMKKISLLSSEISIPILVLSKMSRNPENRNDHRPRISDITHSADITPFADVVLFLYRNDYYDDNAYDNADCILAKGYHTSPDSPLYIPIKWNHEKGFFENPALITL